MRYDFSHHFMRIVPPDTSFSQAWESICAILLRAELGPEGLIPFSPPDYGIDILHRPMKRAYQCKSTAEGAGGTIDGREAASSLETAYKHQHSLDWVIYAFATNAYFSGVGIEKILLRAKGFDLNPDLIEFLGPDYWDQLCCKHSILIEDRFDYKVSAAEKKVLEAVLEIIKEEYGRNSSLGELIASLEQQGSTVTFTNNMTELKIELPLSLDLPIERYLGLLSALLRLSVEWINFRDAQGSMLPNLSIRLNGREVSLGATLRDVGYKVGDHVELNIQAATLSAPTLGGTDESEIYLRLGVSDETITKISRTILETPGAESLAVRATATLQTMIWMGARLLLGRVNKDEDLSHRNVAA